MILERQLKQQGQFLFRYRSYLPLIFLISQALYMRNMDPAALNQLFSNSSLFKIQHAALFVSLLGLVIRCITIGYVPDGTSGRNVRAQRACSLNTTGIYSILRNPLYLGNFIIGLGISFLSISPIFIAAYCFSFSLYYERIIFTEETFLIEKFKKTI